MRGYSYGLLMGLEFSVSYAEDRRVLFRIDGEETSVEEFEHYYTQVYAASRVSVEQFLPHFLYYKLRWQMLKDKLGYYH